MFYNKRTIRATLLALTLLVSIAGCNLPLPESETEAARLYVEKCSVCHEAKHPGLLSGEAWVHIVDRMEKYVIEMGKREPLNDKDKATILNYLKKHATNRAF